MRIINYHTGNEVNEPTVILTAPHVRLLSDTDKAEGPKWELEEHAAETFLTHMGSGFYAQRRHRGQYQRDLLRGVEVKERSHEGVTTHTARHHRCEPKQQSNCGPDKGLRGL